MRLSDHPKRRVLVGSAVAVAAICTGLGFGLWQSTPRRINRSHPLWGVELPDAYGKQIDLSTYTHRPVLINFWATWCAPCIEELSLLDRFYAQHVSTRLQLLTIAIDRPDAVAGFLSQTALRLPVVVAGFEGIALAKSLGDKKGGLPFSVILSSKSGILYSKSGQLTVDDLDILLSLLK